MARLAEGSRVSRNRFGESQLLKGAQESLPVMSGCPAVKALTSITGLLRLNLGRIAAQIHQGDQTSPAHTRPPLARGSSPLGDLALLAAARDSSTRVSCNNVAY